MSGEHTFKAVRDEAGDLIKMKASISNYKDVTVNTFNDKCYVHLSDVSKCFKRGGGFDLKKAKSVTLNTEEINEFIKMTEKLPSVMRKVLASPVHERKKEPVSSADSDASTDDDKKSKKRKTGVKQGVKKTATHQDSDSETESAFPHRKQKQLKKKRTHPYNKPLTETKKRTKSQKATESSDTDVLSD